MSLQFQWRFPGSITFLECGRRFQLLPDWWAWPRREEDGKSNAVDVHVQVSESHVVSQGLQVEQLLGKLKEATRLTDYALQGSKRRIA